MLARVSERECAACRTHGRSATHYGMTARVRALQASMLATCTHTHAADYYSEINLQTGQSLVPSHAAAAAFVQKCKQKLKICGGAIFMNRNLHT